MLRNQLVGEFYVPAFSFQIAFGVGAPSARDCMLAKKRRKDGRAVPVVPPGAPSQ